MWQERIGGVQRTFCNRFGIWIITGRRLEGNEVDEWLGDFLSRVRVQIPSWKSGVRNNGMRVECVV